MRSTQEDSAEVQKKILIELHKLKKHYHLVMLSGVIAGIWVFISAFAFFNTGFIQFLVAWLAISFLGGAVWVYLRAFLRVKQDIGWYNKLLGVKIEKKELLISKFFLQARRIGGNLYLLCFLNGLLLSLFLVVSLQDKYENSFFNGLSRQVVARSPVGREDSLLIRAMGTCHDLLYARSPLFDDQVERSWIDKYIYPLSTDLITAQGACGSYSNILCRLLQTLDYDVRLVQMKAGDTSVCHILVEVNSSRGWVVLDPLYNLYFVRPDGTLASFADVSGNWAWYRWQVPPGYDFHYRYEGARYTNWNKIPVILPVLKNFLGYFMSKESLEHFSLRIYFLRKYLVLKYILLTFLILVFSLLVIRIVRTEQKRQSHASVKRWQLKVPMAKMNWPDSWSN